MIENVSLPGTLMRPRRGSKQSVKREAQRGGKGESGMWTQHLRLQGWDRGVIRWLERCRGPDKTGY
jgi:hypothetical protein